MERRQTRPVRVGNRILGGGNPILIQSMCNTKTEDVAATVAQIRALEDAGCDLVRLAVPTMEAAAAIREIKRSIHIPLVADIHFDYRLAIASMEAGADKVRINPGNIGSRCVSSPMRSGWRFALRLKLPCIRVSGPRSRERCWSF